MVEKVDLINAPQKFAMQQPKVEENKEFKISENKKIDWKTVGLASAAIAATVIGGIWYARRGKTPDSVEKQGEKLGNEFVDNINKEIDEIIDIVPEIKLTPFDLDPNGSVLKYIGKGEKVVDDVDIFEAATINYPTKQQIGFNYYHKIDDKTHLYYDDKTANFTVIGDDIECISYTPKNNYEKTKNVNEYTNVIEFESGESNNLRIFQNEQIADITFGTSSYNLPIKIRYEKCSGKPIFIEYDNVRLDEKFAQEFFKDFDTNKYISDAQYRNYINQRFVDKESMLKFARRNLMNYEQIMNFKSSANFQEILKQGRENSDYVESPACKNVIDTLGKVFGVDSSLQAEELKLPNTFKESDLFKRLYNNIASGYKINMGSIIEYTDGAGNFIKDKNGIIFRLQQLKVQDETLIKKQLKNKIETTLDGRYIRFFDDWNYEYKIYNPEKITNDNPKMTSAFELTTSISLKEYPDKKVYELQPDSFPSPIKITVGSDGKINFNETYIQIHDEHGKIIGTTNLQPEKEDLIKELIEIVDFSKISSRDWQQTFKEMANDILPELPRSVS